MSKHSIAYFISKDEEKCWTATVKKGEVVKLEEVHRGDGKKSSSDCHNTYYPKDSNFEDKFRIFLNNLLKYGEYEDFMNALKNE